MEKFQIKNSFSGKMIFEAEAESFKEAVAAAVRSNADLSYAFLRDVDLMCVNLRFSNLRLANLIKADLRVTDLRGADLSRSHMNRANLRGADLRDACLSDSDLSDADLSGTNLRSACLSNVYLRRADLRRAVLRRAFLIGADLRDADLRGADLRDSDLRGADLRGASLREVKLNWQSHDLISAILLNEAGENLERIKASGLIFSLRGWCWEDFLKLRSEPQFSWAMETLSSYVVDGDEAPEELVNWKNRSSAASGEGGVS